MRWTAMGSAFLLFTVTMMMSGQLFAGEKDLAKKYFNEGNKLQKAADYEGAVKAFEESIAHYPNKNNLYNLANCYRALNRYTDALKVFERIQKEFDEKLGKDMRADIETQVREIKETFATLAIVSVPEGADVVVNGASSGKAPVSLSEREPGVYALKVSLDGYIPVEEKIALDAGAHKEFTATLKEQPASLTVQVNEAGAGIYVDDILEGTAPLEKPLSLSGTTHRVRVSKQGYVSKEQTVELVRGGSTTMALELVPEAPVPATIENPMPTQTSKIDKRETSTRKKSPMFPIGLAGTLVLGATAGAMWAMTSIKKDDYLAHNDHLMRLASVGVWDSRLAAETQSDKDAVSAFNLAAIISTAATGVFVAIMAAGIGVNVHRKKKESSKAVALELTRNGAVVYF